MNDSLKQAFERAAKENLWGDEDSVSGPGSNLTQTQIIRKSIPPLLKKYQVKTFMDAPCGDLFWMREILPQLSNQGVIYIGADIVPDVLEKNENLFKEFKSRFLTLDLTRDHLPKADMVLTRDCFIHLSYSNILRILKNYRKAGITYLLVSTYTDQSRVNINVSDHYLYGRMLNMQKFPFFFPTPKELIVEGCTEGQGEFADKSLGLWEISALDLKRMELYIRLIVWTKPLRSVFRRFGRLLKS